MEKGSSSLAQAPPEEKWSPGSPQFPILKQETAKTQRGHGPEIQKGEVSNHPFWERLVCLKVEGHMQLVLSFSSPCSCVFMILCPPMLRATVRPPLAA